MTYHPELELIIQLCTEGQQQDFARIDALVRAELNWTEIFSNSLWHKTAFICLSQLRKLCLLNVSVTEGTMPLLILNHWKQLEEANGARNKDYLRELAAVAKSFDKRGIQYAVSKGGPLLIGTVYAISERKMYDVDLIAPAEQIKDLQRAMFENGFSHSEYDQDAARLLEMSRDHYRKWLLHTRGIPHFIKLAPGKEAVPLVFQVMTKLGSTQLHQTEDAAALIERRISYGDYAGVYELDLLLQLCLHIYRETKEESFEDWGISYGLIKFVDLDRFIRKLLSARREAEVADFILGNSMSRHITYALRLTVAVFPSPEIYALLDHLGIPPLSKLERDTFMHNLAKVGHVGRPKSKWSALMDARTY